MVDCGVNDDSGMSKYISRSCLDRPRSVLITLEGHVLARTVGNTFGPGIADGQRAEKSWKREVSAADSPRTGTTSHDRALSAFAPNPRLVPRTSGNDPAGDSCEQQCVWTGDKARTG
jgi:hypothetical protein